MIDRRKPDFSNTPLASRRPSFTYARRQLGPGDESPVPLVTITTVFSGGGELFRETARCVFGQSLQTWEWVIVNDGVTDAASLAVLDEFRKADPRVRVIDHPGRRGLGAARNTGIRQARTPYVCLLDAPTLIEPAAIEKYLWYLHTRPATAFVSSNVVALGAEPHLLDRGFHNGDDFLRENLAPPIAALRRAVFDDVGGYDETSDSGMEDWEFWLRCAAKGYWGDTIPEHLTWRRPHAQPVAAHEGDQPRRHAIQREIVEKYQSLLAGRFPKVQHPPVKPFEDITIDAGIANPLAKAAPRVLMIVPWLTMGGADKFNVAMVRELVARGWEVTIATTLGGDNSWMPEFTALTPDVFVWLNFLREPDIPSFLRHLIDSRTPDVVMLTNTEFGHFALPYLRSFCPAPAYVDLSHMEEPWWKNGGHPRYSAGSHSILDLNIVVSEHLKSWQVSRGADADRIEVCYVSACEDSSHWRRDVDARLRVRSELGIADHQPVILYAGRVVDQKQPRIFAQTIHRLAESGLDFTCVVAGDGPDLPWLRSYVVEHGLSSRVRLLGAVPHSDMHGVMSASDVFFLPSRWEGIAISIYEAMSMELAVVGADVGGQRELVTPECGLLVPRSDSEEAEVDAYVAALLDVLRNPDHGRSMGASGRERIRACFEPSHMGDRIIELLALAQRRRDESPRPAIVRGFAIECASRGVEYLRAWEDNEANFRERQRLWTERQQFLSTIDELTRARDELTRKYDELRHGHDKLERDRSELARAYELLQLNLNDAARRSSAPRAPDPSKLAEQVVSENTRYVVADRVNNALKSVHLQRVVKALASRVFRPRP